MRDVAANPGSSVAVQATSTLVASARDGRNYIAITNDSDTGIYLRIASSGATIGAGIYLKADGGAWSEYGWTGPVCAIHGGTGSKNLCVVEV